MLRKYAVITSASSEIGEVVGARLYGEMDSAKIARDAELDRIVAGNTYSSASSAEVRAVAASFVKVYELVAVEL